MNKICFSLVVFLFLIDGLSTLKASGKGRYSPIMMEMTKPRERLNEDRRRQEEGADNESPDFSESGRTTGSGFTLSSRSTVEGIPEEDSQEEDSLTRESDLTTLNEAKAAVDEAEAAIDEEINHSTWDASSTRHLQHCQAALSALSNAQKEVISAFNQKDDSLYQQQAGEVLLRRDSLESILGMSDVERGHYERSDATSLLTARQGTSYADQELEASQNIKNKVLRTLALLHHGDPLHPAKSLNNIVTDGGTFPLILPWAFHMKPVDCIWAGLGANVAQALVASPYLSSRLQECLPDSGRKVVTNASNSIRSFADLDYIAYYVVAWRILKIAHFPGVFAFIVPSAMVRKGVSTLLQSSTYKGSLEQQAAALTSSDPSLSSSLQALQDAIERFGPELSASIARSFFSNYYSYTQGTISAQDVITKTAFSALVYTTATMIYYTFYRGLEMIPRTQAVGTYQAFARNDEVKIQELKEALSAPQSSSAVDVEKLSASLNVLDSPVANLLGDPFYRSLSFSSNTINAFRALDAMKLLRKTLPALQSSDTAQQGDADNAFITLQSYLTQQSSDIESGLTESSPVLAKSKIDALMILFKNFSEQTRSQQPLSEQFSLENQGLLSKSLLRSDYQAIPSSD